jgi:hypothetical protein
MLYPLKQIMLIYLACKHIHCVHFIRCTFCKALTHLHHTGSQTESPVFVPEEPEEQLEVQPQEVPEADEEDVEELPKCPDHCPSSLEKGKSSIFSLGLQLLINALF